MTSDETRPHGPSGHTLGRYRIVGEVARGGMGTVLRVWDEELRRNLALKVLTAGEIERDGPSAGDSSLVKRLASRFREEAQVTGQLDHPGVVPIHEIGVDPSGRMPSRCGS